MHGSGPAKHGVRTLAEAEGYLEGLIDVEALRDQRSARLDLAAIRELLRRCGHPERALRILHVAGSKGKGSTALFAEGLLAALGARVGTFTSPHLESWVERFRIDGQPVDGLVLAEAVEALRPHVDALRAGAGAAPSFFDATTAAALLLFDRFAVDWAILEVGLGGRLDSTNAVLPKVCCITSIELEHTELLGDDLESIAAEKAGILKPSVPAVVGALPPEALEVVRHRARELGAPLEVLGEDFEVTSEPVAPESSVQGPRAIQFRAADGFEVAASLGVLGDQQAGNAALAIAAVRRLGAANDDEVARAVREALPRVALPGRMEMLGTSPWLLVDEAHTGASARALARLLRSIEASPRHAVLSISVGKDLDAIFEALLPCFDRITLTRAEPHRSHAPGDLAKRLHDRGFSATHVEEDPARALRLARASTPPSGLLCVSGSVYLAGRARSVFAEPLS